MKNLIYIIITIIFILPIIFIFATRANPSVAIPKPEVTVVATENKSAVDQNNLSLIIKPPSQKKDIYINNYNYKAINNEQTFGLSSKFPDVTFSPENYDENCNLKDYAGGKKMIIVFWASWCDPCRLEAQNIQKFYDVHKDYAVMTIDIDNFDTSNAKKFMEQFDFSYPVMYGGDAVGKKTAVIGIPKTILIDETGTVKAVKLGSFIDLNEIEFFTGAK